MLRTIIVEDEIQSQKLLQHIIENYCPSLELIGKAVNKEQLVKLLGNASPDLIFMAIELEDCNTFEILEKMTTIHFHIIFTTPYQHFAYKAFEFEAVDYLLKPYCQKDVIKAVDKFKRKRIDINVINLINHLISSETNNQEIKKLKVNTTNGMTFVPIEDVIRVEADGAYVQLYLKNGECHIMSKNLKELEAVLPCRMFFRTHSKHLINMKQVSGFNSEDGGHVVMSNNKF